MANLIEDVNNLSLWKSTTMKKHDVYVCMPPIGTSWSNKLTGVSGVTNSQSRFLLSDYVGDQYCISAVQLAENYRFIDGFDINKKSLSAHMINNVIDWMHLEAKTAKNYWVFYIESKKYGVSKIANCLLHTVYGDVVANKSGIKHGSGDFLVCSDLNGRPNFSDVRLVNGNLFSLEYDMRSFQGFIRDNWNIDKIVEPKSILNIEERFTVDELKRKYSNHLEILAILILQSLYLHTLQEMDSEEVVEKILKGSQMKYGTISDMTSSNLVSCGNGLLLLRPNLKIYIRVGISKSARVAINFQVYNNSKLVNNVIISNDSLLCTQALNEILLQYDKYKRNIDKFMTFIDNSVINSENIRLLQYRIQGSHIEDLILRCLKYFKIVLKSY